MATSPSNSRPSDARPETPSVTIHLHQRGGLLRYLAWFGWIAFAICLVALLVMTQRQADYFDTAHGVTEKFHSGSQSAGDKIAVIRVAGLIADGEGFVKDQIERVRADQRIKAVVIRVNSPGGTVTGSDYMFHHLRRLRDERKLPMVVSMGSVAASGGYYVSMAVGEQENSIYAEPTTTTGSIGVVIPHYDLSGLLNRLDVKDDSIASHPRKTMLSMTRPVPDEHREIAQGYITELFGRFKKIVIEGRPAFREKPEALDALATGEVFTADRALATGLVDRIGFIEDAIERAAELAGLNKDQVRVVAYDQAGFSLGQLTGLALGRRSKPRSFTAHAYYLAGESVALSELLEMLPLGGAEDDLGEAPDIMGQAWSNLRRAGGDRE